MPAPMASVGASRLAAASAATVGSMARAASAASASALPSSSSPGWTPSARNGTRLPFSRSRATIGNPMNTSSSGVRTCSTNAGVSSPKRMSPEDSRAAPKAAAFWRWPSRYSVVPV